jgi:hypothetical protein
MCMFVFLQKHLHAVPYLPYLLLMSRLMHASVSVQAAPVMAWSPVQRGMCQHSTAVCFGLVVLAAAGCSSSSTQSMLGR